ncbi:MAG: DEAD/DEAH box helicase [Sulfuricellaceae bacterium]|jgi:ATP-dependent RNA helicase RhlE
MTFADLGLSTEILKAITDQGYTEPTPIQAQAIPVVLEGRDIMAGAQTGTGKTAAFTLPLLQRLLPFANASTSPAMHPVRALILTPTRELAMQVEESVKTYGKYLPLRSTAVYGGVNITPQTEALRRGVEVLVATPGRLLDHLQQKSVNLSQVSFLVLDEADRMLDMGFIPDIRRILALMPPRRQNLLFSATFAPEIKKLADTLLTAPVTIEVARRNSAAETVTQSVYLVEEKKKRDVLTNLIRTHNMRQVLVFTRTKLSAERLFRQLERDGIASAAIHGDKSQIQRTQALNDFKEGKIVALVATDVAARGLDIDELPHVINYELPPVPEDYVHRIGRTGRAGATGDALSLVSPEENKFLAEIERVLKRTLPRETPPETGTSFRSKRHPVAHSAHAEEANAEPPAFFGTQPLPEEKPAPAATPRKQPQLAALLGGIPWKRD